MKNPYRTLTSREVYKGGVFRVREDEVEKPGGTRGPFVVVEMKSGSSILPLDEHGNVHLIREFKYAVNHESLECASGAMEPGETLLACAKRELKEEVGLTADEWIDLGFIDPATTQLIGPNYLFLARGLHRTERDLDEGEVLEVECMAMAQAVELVLQSKITHADSCALILKADAWIRANPVQA